MKTCRRNGFEISMCTCTGCNNIFPIPRRKSNRRKNGHKKTIYCPFCDNEMIMREAHHSYI